MTPNKRLCDKVSTLISDKNSEKIVKLVTDEIIADIKNKMGYITSLIDLISINDVDFYNENINERLLKSKKVIDYIRNYDFNNKYKKI